MFEPDQEVEVQSSSALGLDHSEVSSHTAKYTHTAFDLGRSYFDTEQRLEDGIDHEMEELCSCIGVVRDVLCPLILVRTQVRHELVHVDFFPRKDLCNRIVEIRGVYGDPE